MERIYKTLQFYEKNASSLYEKYQNSSLKELHKIMLKYIKKDDFILELGFGSGREIEFLLENGFNNVYGIEGCKNFLIKAQEKFDKNRFFYSILPQVNLPDIKFDFIYSIALWMHLPSEMYKKTLDNIMKYLKINGKILFSYSLDERKSDNRYFFRVDEKLIENILKEYKKRKIEEKITFDSLGRNLRWKIVIFG